MEKQTSTYLSSFLFVALGNFIYALAVKLFVLPANLVLGGTTGIAFTVGNFINIPLSAFVFIFNMIMLVVGLLFLGKKFALTTVASSILYPFFLEILNRVIGDYVLTGDTLLCTIFAGMGIGIALGIVIRSGASTGGMDIPPLVLNKKFKIPVSVGLYFFDSLIILSQCFFRPMESILYAVILTIIYTVILNKVLIIGTTKTQVKIISKKSEEIRKAIMSEVDRGVTMLDGEGGFSRDKTQVVLSVLTNREIPKVEKLIHEIDPESFIVISQVTEVKGHGFSLKKVWGNS